MLQTACVIYFCRDLENELLWAWLLNLFWSSTQETVVILSGVAGALEHLEQLLPQTLRGPISKIFSGGVEGIVDNGVICA